MDGDDEVRDRATYFKIILEQQQQNLNSQFILNGLQVIALVFVISSHNLEHFQYRVLHLLGYLGWIDLDFGFPPSTWFCLG